MIIPISMSIHQFNIRRKLPAHIVLLHRRPESDDQRATLRASVLLDAYALSNRRVSAAYALKRTEVLAGLAGHYLPPIFP